jgi:hypothetical protein
MDGEAVRRIDLQAICQYLELRFNRTDCRPGAFSLSHEDGEMANLDDDGKKEARGGDNGPSSDAASTLLPMLVGGLVLTIVALVVVVMLV